MGTEVPIPDTARAGRARGIQMHHGILPAVGMRSSRVERSGRPRASFGQDSAEALGIGLDGNIEGSNGDQAVQCLPVSKEAPLLGQSFLGAGLLRGHGRPEQLNDSEIRKVPGKGRATSGTVAT